MRSFASRRCAAARRGEEGLLDLDALLTKGPLRHEATRADAQTFGALLKHCGVLVRLFSTTTPEGFLLDRPVVMAAPSSGLGHYDVNSVSDLRLWDHFVHLGPLVQSGAARVARSPAELVDQVRGGYLADLSMDADKCREIARLGCGSTDGDASRRTAVAPLAAIDESAPR